MDQTLIKEKNIENLIYEIRGKQVMLDSDLARLYDVETKRINEAVKNNSLKFHDRYFILDNKIVYHCGTSINRIGYKTFSITILSDKKVCTSLIDSVNKIIQ